MPNIPVYLSQTQAAGASASPRASGEAFGAGIGRGIQEVGQGLGKIGKTIQALEEQKAKRDASAYSAKELSQIQLDTLQATSELKKDPNIDTYSERVGTYYDERLKAALDNAPNQLAKDAIQKEGYSHKVTLLKEANKYQAVTKTTVQKGEIAQSIDNITNSLLLDPDNYKTYAAQANQVLDVSSSVFDAAEVQSLRMNTANQLAAAKISAEININPNYALHLLSEDEFKNSVDAKTFATLHRQATNEIKSRQQEAVRLQQRKLTLLRDDPAGFALLEGATSPGEAIAIQETYGITPDNISIIPKEDAEKAVSDLNGLNNSDQAILAFRNLQQSYGKYYNTALRDLKRNGLSDQLVFISYMNPNTDKNIMDASFAMAKDPKGWKDIATTRGVTQDDISKQIESNVSDVRDALIPEGGEVSTLNSKMDAIATYFVATGMDKDVAAKLATEWFTKKAPLMSPNNFKTRIPVSETGDAIYDADLLEEGLDTALNDLKPEDVSLEVGDTAWDFKTLKRTSRFVLSNDETSYYLKNAAGVPVLDRNNNIIRFDIDELISRVDDKRIEKQNQMFEFIQMY